MCKMLCLKIIAIFLISLECCCDVRFDEARMNATDRYGSLSTLFYDGGTLNFNCPNKTFSKKQTPVNESLKLHNESIGEYACGEYEFKVGYLLCKDESDECQSNCTDQDKSSFCVISKGKIPTCRPLNLGECSTYDFGRKSIGRHCSKLNSDEKDSLCYLFSKNTPATFIDSDKSCKNVNHMKPNVTTSNGTELYLGSVSQLGSSLIVTCNGTKCASCSVKELTSATISNLLMYDPELKIFKVPVKNYSAVTKIIINIKENGFDLSSYYYNIRLNASVVMNKFGNTITCVLKYPPIEWQKGMFKISINITYNGSLNLDLNKTFDGASAELKGSGDYVCNTVVKFKMCSPYFTADEKDSRNFSYHVKIPKPDVDWEIIHMIIGIVGGVACVFIVCLLFVCFVRRRKKKGRNLSGHRNETRAAIRRLRKYEKYCHEQDKKEFAKMKKEEEARWRMAEEWFDSAVFGGWDRYCNASGARKVALGKKLREELVVDRPWKRAKPTQRTKEKKGPKGNSDETPLRFAKATIDDNKVLDLSYSPKARASRMARENLNPKLVPKRSVSRSPSPHK